MFLKFWEVLEDAKDCRYYGQVAESCKLEKKKVQRNLVRVRSLEGLDTSNRLDLEGLLQFMYPNYIF